MTHSVDGTDLGILVRRCGVGGSGDKETDELRRCEHWVTRGGSRDDRGRVVNIGGVGIGRLIVKDGVEANVVKRIVRSYAV